MDTELLEEYRLQDLLWSLMNITLANNVPTWVEYNSLLSSLRFVSTYSSLPLLNGNPTDWSNLYSTLQVVQKLTNKLSPDRKTVVSFDLQLYAKCVQLQSRVSVAKDFVFRMSEPHTVFAMLKCLGKYIDSSGLGRPLWSR